MRVLSTKDVCYRKGSREVKPCPGMLIEMPLTFFSFKTDTIDGISEKNCALPLEPLTMMKIFASGSSDPNT